MTNDALGCAKHRSSKQTKAIWAFEIQAISRKQRRRGVDKYPKFRHFFLAARFQKKRDARKSRQRKPKKGKLAHFSRGPSLPPSLPGLRIRGSSAHI